MTCHRRRVARLIPGSVHQALLILALVLPLPGGAAEAQSRISPTAAQVQAMAALRPGSENFHSAEPVRDYRWEGLAIGAGVVGLAGALLMHGACEANEACTGPTVSGFLLGAVVGGVTGGLIGAMIAKGDREP